ncbi:unnamed protein product, partial [marine sediment metagenome]
VEIALSGSEYDPALLNFEDINKELANLDQYIHEIEQVDYWR